MVLLVSAPSCVQWRHVACLSRSCWESGRQKGHGGRGKKSCVLPPSRKRIVWSDGPPNPTLPRPQVDKTPAKASFSEHHWSQASHLPCFTIQRFCVVASSGDLRFGAQIACREVCLCCRNPKAGTQNPGLSTVTSQNASHLTCLEHTFVSSLIIWMIHDFALWEWSVTVSRKLFRSIIKISCVLSAWVPSFEKPLCHESEVQK